MIDVVKRNGDRIDTAKLAASCWAARWLRPQRCEGRRVAWRLRKRRSSWPRSGKADRPQHELLRHGGAGAWTAIGDIDPRTWFLRNQLRWYAIKLFERDEKVLEQFTLDSGVHGQRWRRSSSPARRSWTTTPRASSPMSGTLTSAKLVEALCQEKEPCRPHHLRQDRPDCHQPLSGPADLCGA